MEEEEEEEEGRPNRCLSIGRGERERPMQQSGKEGGEKGGGMPNQRQRKNNVTFASFSNYSLGVGNVYAF